MFRISCFADEISPELSEQIYVMKENNVKFVELRGVWNKNVLDLTDSELDTILTQFSQNGIRVSSIGSPIGKVDVNDDFDRHLERFRRAVAVAKKMNSNYIRIFSFYMKKDEFDLHEKTVIDRINRMLSIAVQNNLILLHENEAGIFGEASVRCRRLFDALPSASFGAVFDPSNFVTAGEDVLHESFPRMQQHIRYMHIKDSVRGGQGAVPAGQGDGKVPEILHALRDRDGMFLSLEPHLAQYGQFKGFTGPALFVKAYEALKSILESQEIEFA